MRPSTAIRQENAVRVSWRLGQQATPEIPRINKNLNIRSTILSVVGRTPVLRNFHLRRRRGILVSRELFNKIDSSSAAKHMALIFTLACGFYFLSFVVLPLYGWCCYTLGAFPDTQPRIYMHPNSRGLRMS